MIVDIFAGPGGWDVGARIAGYDGPLVGIEHDRAACLTAAAAGHWRIQADVKRYPTSPFVGRVHGLIGSPPCTTFSSAGQGAGRQVMGILATALTRIMRGRKAIAWAEREAARALRGYALTTMGKATRAERSRWAREQARMSALVLQSARWIVATAPPWVALEQVPGVLPLWRHLAALLRERGYRAWAGILSAEEHGVPQTRKRAVLMASLDVAVGAPVATHQSYRAGRDAQVDDDLFGSPLPPPISMAQALGWDGGELVGFPRLADTASNKTSEVVELDGVGYRARDLRAAGAPAHALTEKVRSWERYMLRGGPQDNATSRTGDEPAPTVMCSRPGNLQWHANADQRYGDRAGTDAVRVTVAEAGVLQSFPADYPWRGTKTAQYRCVGDAVPPLLAAAILRPLLAASSSGQRAA